VGPRLGRETLDERVVQLQLVCLHEIGLNRGVGSVGKVDEANFDMHCTCHLGRCTCALILHVKAAKLITMSYRKHPLIARLNQLSLF
jgi:hypothetical protein